MSKHFVISDTHFFDYQIIEYSKARHGIFHSVSEMNEKLIENWNSVVSFDDTVYHLGDVAKLYNKDTLEILKKLNGKIHLVLGNHDNISFSISSGVFKSINSWVKMENYKVILSHFPLDRMSYSAYGEDWVNIHGHMHCLSSPQGGYNVCVEAIGYKPIEIAEVLSK